MKTSEQKKIIIDALSPYFEKNKIIGKNIWTLLYSFNLFTENNILRGNIFFSQYESPEFISSLIITEVERIIWENQFPNYDGFNKAKIEEYPLITVDCGDFKKFIKNKFDGFSDENSYQRYAKLIIQYLQTDGQEFINTYSYLPNILTKMDELQKEGKYWSEILSGTADNLFRGLIISKLCNDINFNEKIKYTDKIFYEEPDEWLPYYEKLKERLKIVEPIYNV